MEISMAKKAASDSGTPINKSQAIRDFLAGNPEADTKAVVAGLAEKGIRVAPTLVYFIRSKQRQAKRRAKRDRVSESSRQTGSKNPVEVILRVKDLAREVGGIKNLKLLVDLLAE
jgi:hypothetical protein